MRPIPISDRNDPRIRLYTDLRQSRAASRRAQRSGTFIAEGRLVVDRLIESDYVVESLLIQHGSHEPYLAALSDDTPVYTMTPDLISQTVGFDFHRGVMACGRRRKLSSPITTAKLPATGHAVGSGTTASGSNLLSAPLSVALLGITEQENMGSILRTAAALGINDIVLAPGTIDPFSRRVIRVSMATVFKHRFYRIDDVATELQALQNIGIHIIASTLADDSQAIDVLQTNGRPKMLMIGNEASGIAPEIQSIADDRVKIPMSLGVDSLNAAVPAAILMYELAK